MNNSKGFTLIEVMVAIAIFAVMFTSLMTSMSIAARNATTIERQQKAMWVAQYAIEEYRINGIPDRDGMQTEQLEMFGATWYIEANFKPSANEQYKDSLKIIELVVKAQSNQEQQDAYIVSLIGVHR